MKDAACGQPGGGLKSLDKRYKALLQKVHKELLRPLGFRKEGQDFRRIAPDGLGKIVAFRKDKWNREDRLGFCIWTGVYFESPNFSLC